MLSKKTRYAINALVYIAKNKDQQPISVSKISEDQKIPLKFLETILNELKNARIVNSQKGKYGGYSLNQAPDKIDLVRVMRLFDGPISILPCVSLEFYHQCEECSDEKTCGLRQVAMEIRDATLERLTKATLANIIERERKMKKK